MILKWNKRWKIKVRKGGKRGERGEEFKEYEEVKKRK